MKIWKLKEVINDLDDFDELVMEIDGHEWEVKDYRTVGTYLFFMNSQARIRLEQAEAYLQIEGELER